MGYSMVFGDKNIIAFDVENRDLILDEEATWVGDISKPCKIHVLRGTTKYVPAMDVRYMIQMGYHEGLAVICAHLRCILVAQHMLVVPKNAVVSVEEDTVGYSCSAPMYKGLMNNATSLGQAKAWVDQFVSLYIAQLLNPQLEVDLTESTMNYILSIDGLTPIAQAVFCDFALSSMLAPFKEDYLCLVFSNVPYTKTVKSMFPLYDRYIKSDHVKELKLIFATYILLKRAIANESIRFACKNLRTAMIQLFSVLMDLESISMGKLASRLKAENVMVRENCNQLPNVIAKLLNILTEMELLKDIPKDCMKDLKALSEMKKKSPSMKHTVKTLRQNNRMSTYNELEEMCSIILTVVPARY